MAHKSLIKFTNEADLMKAYVVFKQAKLLEKIDTQAKLILIENSWTPEEIKLFVQREAQVASKVEVVQQPQA